jgi:hypothetical protein
MRLLVGSTARLLVTVLIFAVFAYGSRGVAEGEDWMKWDSDTREIYVGCYFVAFNHGFKSACKKAALSDKSSSASKVSEAPDEPCVAKMPQFTRPVEFYSQKITDYYRSYPSDRYAMIRELLDYMSDSQNLTLEQIHERLKGRIPSPKP